MSAVGGNEASGQKANEPRFFYEDEVFRFHRGHLQFGMVVENSEFVSSDDDDDGDDRQRPKQGFVRVAWHPKGHEDVIKETKVALQIANRISFFLLLYAFILCNRIFIFEASSHEIS